MLEKDRWQTRAGKLICLTIALVSIYITLKYGLGLLIPFLFAFAVAMPISALSSKSAVKFGGKKRVWTIFYLCIFFVGLLLFFVLVVGKIAKEGIQLLDYLSENGQRIGDDISESAKRLMEIPSRVPFLARISDIEIFSGLGDYISQTSRALSEKFAQAGGEVLIKGVVKTILGTSRLLISTAVAVLSSVYLALEYEDIKEYMLGLLSKGARERTQRLIDRIGKGFKGYITAYGKMFLITFSLLYIGLFILGRRYAFLLAVIVAALDLLPFFGTGIVLVPWGVILLFGGDYAVGVGMLVLFAVITVVRQIAEPRLIGKGIGIHPLASLISIYIGLRTFGFWGMILAPIGVLVGKEILENNRKDTQ